MLGSGSLQELVVLRMGADPHPEQSLSWCIDSQGAMPQADTH